MEETKARLFTVVQGRKIRNHSHKLKHKRLSLNTRRSFFHMRRVRQRHRLH